ncbi:response regulator [Clostridium sp. 19966]|uniref:response regulator n=1 Tax=Clostridium sp. 19966 TaxID=2768166 RepID=UPI0028DF500D|nr:response regulator [Clostridium sp. 19966]MDT8717265.1 response regulator [Clostridium sp. 19966]
MYKVMIVDDEPFVRQGLISLINWAEYDFQICCESDNGIDALKSAKEYSPDLIITDIRMPEMSGLELIRECEKELKSGCKYIILSGYSEFEYARQAMSYGVVNYILKPIDEDEVKESLARIKKELDEKNQRLSSFLDYKILAANVLKKYMNGQADKNKLNKVREFIPNFDKGKFCYGIILPIEIENKELKEYSVAQMVKKFISRVFAQSTFIYVIEEENT